MSAPPRPAGSVGWIELRTADADAARAFYAATLGWGFGGTPGPNGSGEAIHLDHALVGGLRTGPAAGDVPQWVAFVEVEDLEEVVAAAVAGGGSAGDPTSCDDGSRRVDLVDPAGALLAAFEPAPDSEGLLWGSDGAPCWAECLSRDVPAARAFYPAVFGWEVEPAVDGYTVFSVTSRRVAGLMEMPPMVPAEAPSTWTVYFAVSDLDGACRAATQAGGAIVAPAMELDIGRFAVIEDPTRAVCSFFEGDIG